VTRRRPRPAATDRTALDAPPPDRLLAELRSVETILAVLIRHASRCAQIEVLQAIDNQEESHDR
jgi:hypothetical protein